MFHRVRQSIAMRNSAAVRSSQSVTTPTPTTLMNTIGNSRFNQIRGCATESAEKASSGLKKSGLLNRYNMWSQRSPVTCILVTSSALWCLGDLSAQYIEGGTSTPVAQTPEERDAMMKNSQSGLQRFLPSSLRFLWSKDWYTVEILRNSDDSAALTTTSGAGFCLDLRRLVATTVFGSLIAGVGGQMWYKYLDHIVLNVLKMENRGTRFVLTKWAIECVFWHPITLLAFWVFVGLTGGGDSPDAIKRQLRSDFMGTYAAEVMLYTPVDILNFSKVPLHLQVVVCNVASFFEAIMLSYLHNLSAQNEKKSH